MSKDRESQVFVTHSSPLDRQRPAPERPLLICLLPARNAAHDLPGFLESVDRCCDAVVALDDGSTDGTWDVLNGHPLVKILLRNPQREDYRGWDDAANRNQVLVAAAELNPAWLLSLDADERLDERDAISLRRFLETDALPGCAYGFRHVEMQDDAEHFLPKYQWIYRLFSAAPDQHFPSQKLHFIPIPTSIPRHRWIKTTLRIQHLGGMNTERRLSRFNKYLEADPHRTYQADYAQFFVSWPSEDDLRRWQPRPESVPVLLESNADDAGGEPHGDTTGAIPSLSVIVFAQNDERTITRTVASVIHQEVAEPFEVILVTSGNDQTASIVRERFPTVTVIELPKPALPGEARNAGLAVARGRFVEFPESNVELLPGYLAASLRAHRRGYAMVTGLVTNGTPTPAGWAAYFLDHAEKLPGHDPAEFNGAPGRCSYARLPLLEVGGFPEAVRTGEDTAVNRALARRGYVAVRDPEVQLIHFNRCATPPQLLRHHFRRGRGWGRMVVAEYRDRGHLLNRKLIRTRLIESVPKRLRRIERSVSFARADIIAEHRRHQGLIVLGAVATWVGMWYEILRPTPGKLSVLLGRPVLNVLMVGCGGDRDIALVQVDEVSGKITRQIVSPGVLVPHDGELVPLTELFKLDHSQLHQTIRQVAGKALRIPYLECIIDPRSELQGKSSPPNGYIVPKETLPARLLEAAVTTIAVLRAQRRGLLHTTLPVWRTARVISGVRAARRSN